MFSLRNNLEFVLFIIIFFLINLVLFVARFFEYWDSKNYDLTRNWWIIFAKASGQGLNFTSVFILIVMLRHGITKLREMGLSAILPLDKHIYIHKVTGKLIVFYSLIHSGAHMGNLCKMNICTYFSWYFFWIRICYLFSGQKTYLDFFNFLYLHILKWKKISAEINSYEYPQNYWEFFGIFIYIYI